MHFVEIIKDAYLIELDPKIDQRGAFCRLFCSEVFQSAGIEEKNFVQVNLSDNHRVGTLRGMHYQSEPYLEAKIVYSLKGRVFDVILDLRKGSPTYLQHAAVELYPSIALYVPKGYAHGFLTLENESQLLYLMSDYYQPRYERGARFDDPAFNINWPFPPSIISEKDLNYSRFEENYASL